MIVHLLWAFSFIFLSILYNVSLNMSTKPKVIGIISDWWFILTLIFWSHYNRIIGQRSMFLVLRDFMSRDLHARLQK